MNTEELNITTHDLIKHLRQLMPLGPQIATLVTAAADRLEELQRQVEIERAELKEALSERTEARAEVERLKQLKSDWNADADYWKAETNLALKQRNEARAEVERLKQELHDTIESYKLNNLQPKTTRPEPSRLEIASMVYAGQQFKSTELALIIADSLIAAAREGK
jgi:uncharacterized coiled-coil DUF342 family protein